MKLLLCAIAGYLLGSISVSILVTKYIFHADLRQQGSGNAGATNAARVYGLGAGVLTFAGDFAKSILAMLLGRGLGGVMGLAVGGAACLLGHCFPVYFKFKGGKGIAVAVGCLFVTFGVMGALLEIAVFAVVVAISRFVSAGSLAAAIVCPIFAAYYFLFQVFDPIAWVLCLVTALVVIWAHRGNIHRLATGTERRIGDKAKE